MKTFLRWIILNFHLTYGLKGATFDDFMDYTAFLALIISMSNISTNTDPIVIHIETRNMYVLFSVVREQLPAVRLGFPAQKLSRHSLTLLQNPSN